MASCPPPYSPAPARLPLPDLARPPPALPRLPKLPVHHFHHLSYLPPSTGLTIYTPLEMEKKKEFVRTLAHRSWRREETEGRGDLPMVNLAAPVWILPPNMVDPPPPPPPPDSSICRGRSPCVCEGGGHQWDIEGHLPSLAQHGPPCLQGPCLTGRPGWPGSPSSPTGADGRRHCRTPDGMRGGAPSLCPSGWRRSRRGVVVPVLSHQCLRSMGKGGSVGVRA